MIDLDTNVLIRYIVQDDELQARLASDLIETNVLQKILHLSMKSLCAKSYGY